MKAKRADYILIALFVLAGAVLTLLIYLPHRTAGNLVEVRLDGEVIKTLPLTESHEETIDIPDGGSNTFAIKENTVSMTDADCPDRICVNTKTISGTGETIVCLPHKLVLAIVSTDEQDDSLDAVTGGAK